jgi:hypothetical protein
MKCEAHEWQDAIGYCKGCGRFGCTDCLVRFKDRSLYCKACIKKLGLRAPKEAMRAREDHVAQKLVVHLRDGKVVKGTSYRLNPVYEGFYLAPISKRGRGEEVYIRFSDIKAVFFVKDFQRAPKTQKHKHDIHSGYEVSVCFYDGEVLEGYTPSNYRSTLPRFYISPKNPDDNAYDVLVERSATVRVDVGGRSKPVPFTPNDLISSPLKRKILEYYWRNPNRSEPVDVFCRSLGVDLMKLEAELAPFFYFHLMRISRESDSPAIVMSSPDSRSLREFIQKRLDLFQSYQR